VKESHYLPFDWFAGPIPKAAGLLRCAFGNNRQ
jgi:hypothetical protein